MTRPTRTTRAPTAMHPTEGPTEVPAAAASALLRSHTSGLSTTGRWRPSPPNLALLRPLLSRRRLGTCHRHAVGRSGAVQAPEEKQEEEDQEEEQEEDQEEKQEEQSQQSQQQQQQQQRPCLWW